MNPFLVGLAGACVLVAGAAWPDTAKVRSPRRSFKNWLLAAGGIVMLAYAILQFRAGGHIFFVFLQSMVVLASVLMMADVGDRADALLIGSASAALIAWSLFLMDNYYVIVFILGLTGIGMGYAFAMGSLRRNIALTLGAVLISLFSYHEKSWVFFWLNVFFTVFSAYYTARGLRTNKAP